MKEYKSLFVKALVVGAVILALTLGFGIVGAIAAAILASLYSGYKAYKDGKDTNQPFWATGAFWFTVGFAAVALAIYLVENAEK